MLKEQETAFWDIIEIFHKEELLPFVMLIGSWAEYIYKYHFKSDFSPNLRTRDVDFLFLNLNRPNKKINLSNALKEKGFSYTESPISGIGKFFKEDLLEIEFLTRVLGKGQMTYKIPSINITIGGLRIVNMLADYPLKLDCNNYKIIVPEPEAYILQKLLTNPTRLPETKKEKDIMAIRELLPSINKNRLHQIFNEMTKKNQKIVISVCEERYINLGLII